MKKFLAVAVLALAMSGCGNQAYVVHPGAVNTFDSQTYDVLVTADAAIQATKTQIANGSFNANATLARNVAVVLNAAIQAYNIADTSYLAYHAAAVAVPSTATQAQVTQLQGQLTTLNNSIAALNAAKAGK